MNKLAAFVAVGVLALGGCSSFPSYDGKSGGGGAAAGGGTKEAATAAIAAAEAAYNATNKTGFSWRDSEKNIKEAKVKVEKGEFDAAIKIAKEVEAQEKAAMGQVDASKSAKPWLF